MPTRARVHFGKFRAKIIPRQMMAVLTLCTVVMTSASLSRGETISYTFTAGNYNITNLHPFYDSDGGIYFTAPVNVAALGSVTTSTTLDNSTAALLFGYGAFGVYTEGNTTGVVASFNNLSAVGTSFENEFGTADFQDPTSTFTESQVAAILSSATPELGFAPYFNNPATAPMAAFQDNYFNFPLILSTETPIGQTTNLIGFSNGQLVGSGSLSIPTASTPLPSSATGGLTLLACTAIYQSWRLSRRRNVMVGI